MERLNWHMAEELARVAEVRIIGPTGSAALAPSGIVVREAPLKPLWKFLLAARRLARREARQWRPDIILAGSGLTAPLVRAAARTCGARTAAYVHGLDVAVKHPVYRAFWLPAIRRMNRIIANSRATAELCHQIGVKPDRIGIVHPGVDLPVAIQHNLANRPLLLSVGRLSARKGLREFVTLSLPRIVAAQPEVMLLIVGDAPHQALHAEAQTRESIQAAADVAGVGEHIRFLGKISDSELQNCWKAADVHVFPIRYIPNDPEGFGMVAVEAAAHGVPSVAFATGGVVDAVAEGRSGFLIMPGDYGAFADAVLRCLAKGTSMQIGSAAFASQFIWPEFGKQVIAQLHGMAE
ncbi:MAG TPA: glycosyltransferase family 4 protein [Rhodanobacteraceae bacterium]|nr:glycosyltransferase family 4 protein [Rhodanobacteraceae bacterium]